MNLENIVQVQRNPRLMGISSDDLESLRSFLGSAYGIVPAFDADVELAILEQDPKYCVAVRRIKALNRQRTAEVSAFARMKAERDFYDAIAADPISGIFHSTKWAFILDVAAYVQRLVELLGVTGRVVDFGCNVGYHASWLAMNSKCQVAGFDQSGTAIGYARNKAAALGLTADRLEFHTQWRGDVLSEGGIDILLCSDGPVDWSASDLRRFGRLLSGNGLLVWVGPMGALGDDPSRTALSAGLHLVHTDVVGGWTASGFQANTVAIAARKMVGASIDDFAVNAERVWDQGFRDFCNGGRYLRDRQTLGHYRSVLVSAP